MLHFLKGPITPEAISNLPGATPLSERISLCIGFPTYVVKNPESDKRVQAAIHRLGCLMGYGENEFDFVLPVCPRKEDSSNPSPFDLDEKEKLPLVLQELCEMELNFTNGNEPSLDPQLANYYRGFFRLLAYYFYGEKDKETQEDEKALAWENLATRYPTFIKGFKEGQRDKEKKKLIQDIQGRYAFPLPSSLPRQALVQSTREDIEDSQHPYNIGDIRTIFESREIGADTVVYLAEPRALASDASKEAKEALRQAILVAYRDKESPIIIPTDIAAKDKIPHWIALIVRLIRDHEKITREIHYFDHTSTEPVSKEAFKEINKIVEDIGTQCQKEIAFKLTTLDEVELPNKTKESQLEAIYASGPQMITGVLQRIVNNNEPNLNTQELRKNQAKYFPSERQTLPPVAQPTNNQGPKKTVLGRLWGWIKKKWNGLKDKVRGRNTEANRDTAHVSVARSELDPQLASQESAATDVQTKLANLKLLVDFRMADDHVYQTYQNKLTKIQGVLSTTYNQVDQALDEANPFYKVPPRYQQSDAEKEEQAKQEKDCWDRNIKNTKDLGLELKELSNILYAEQRSYQKNLKESMRKANAIAHLQEEDNVLMYPEVPQVWKNALNALNKIDEAISRLIPDSDLSLQDCGELALNRVIQQIYMKIVLDANFRMRDRKNKKLLELFDKYFVADNDSQAEKREALVEAFQQDQPIAKECLTLLKIFTKNKRDILHQFLSSQPLASTQQVVVDTWCLNNLTDVILNFGDISEVLDHLETYYSQQTLFNPQVNPQVQSVAVAEKIYGLLNSNKIGLTLPDRQKLERIDQYREFYTPLSQCFKKDAQASDFKELCTFYQTKDPQMAYQYFKCFLKQHQLVQQQHPNLIALTQWITEQPPFKPLATKDDDYFTMLDSLVSDLCSMQIKLIPSLVKNYLISQYDRTQFSVLEGKANPLLYWYAQQRDRVTKLKWEDMRKSILTKIAADTKHLETDDSFINAWQFLKVASNLTLWGKNLFRSEHLDQLRQIYFQNLDNVFDKTSQAIQEAQERRSYRRAVTLISNFNELRIDQSTIILRKIKEFSGQYINRLIDTIFDQDPKPALTELARIQKQGYLIRIIEGDKTLPIITSEELVNRILEKIEKRDKRLEKSLYAHLCSTLPILKRALEVGTLFYPIFITAVAAFDDDNSVQNNALSKLEAQRKAGKDNIDNFLRGMPDEPNARWFEVISGGKLISREQKDIAMMLDKLKTNAQSYIQKLIDQAFGGDSNALGILQEISMRGYFIEVQVWKKEKNDWEREKIVAPQMILNWCTSALASKNLPNLEVCTWVLSLFDENNPSFSGPWSNCLIEMIFTYASNNTKLLKVAHDFTIKHFAKNPFDKIQELNEYLDLLNKYPLEKRSELFSGGKKVQPASEWVEVYNYYVERSKQSTADPHLLIGANLIMNHFCSAEEQGQIQDAEFAEVAVTSLVQLLKQPGIFDLSNEINHLIKEKRGVTSEPYQNDVMSKTAESLLQQQAFLKFIFQKCKDTGKKVELKRLFEAEVMKVNDALCHCVTQTSSTLENYYDEENHQIPETLLGNLRIILQHIEKEGERYTQLKRDSARYFSEVKDFLASALTSSHDIQTFKYETAIEFLWRLYHIDKNLLNQIPEVTNDLRALMKEPWKFLISNLHPLADVFMGKGDKENEEERTRRAQQLITCFDFLEKYEKSRTEDAYGVGLEKDAQEVCLILERQVQALDSFFVRHILVSSFSPDSGVDPFHDKEFWWFSLHSEKRDNPPKNYVEESLAERCVQRWRAYLLACPNNSSKDSNELLEKLLKVLKRNSSLDPKDALLDPKDVLLAFNAELTEKLGKKGDILTKAFTYLEARGPSDVISKMQSEIKSLYGYLKNKSTPFEEFSGPAANEKQDYICDLVSHGSLLEAMIELQALQDYYHLANLPEAFWLKFQIAIDYRLTTLSKIDITDITPSEDKLLFENLKKLLVISRNHSETSENITAIEQQLKDLENSVVLQQWLNENLKTLESFISSPSNQKLRITTFDIENNLPKVFYLSYKQSINFAGLLKELIDMSPVELTIQQELIKKINKLFSLAQGCGAEVEKLPLELNEQVEEAQKVLNNFFNCIVLKRVQDSFQKQLEEDLKIIGKSNCENFELIWQTQISQKLKDNLGMTIILKTERGLQKETTQPEEQEKTTQQPEEQENLFNRLDEDTQLQVTQTLALFILFNQLKISGDLPEQLNDIIDQIEDQIACCSEKMKQEGSNDVIGSLLNLPHLEKLNKIKKTLEEAVNSLIETKETSVEAADSLNLQCQSLQRATRKLQTLLANLADPQKNLNLAEKSKTESSFRVFWSKRELRIINQLKVLSQMDMSSLESQSVIENLKNLFGIFEGNSLPQSSVVSLAKLQVAQMKQQLEDLEKSAVLFEWLHKVMSMAYAFFSKGFDISRLKEFNLVQDLVKVSTFNTDLPKVFYLSKEQSEVLEKLLKELRNKVRGIDNGLLNVKLTKDLLNKLKLTIKSGKIFDATLIQEQKTVPLNEHVLQTKRLLNNLSNHILLEQAGKKIKQGLQAICVNNLPQWQWPENPILEAVVNTISNQLEKSGIGLINQQRLSFNTIWDMIRQDKGKRKICDKFDRWLNEQNEDKKLLATQVLYSLAQLKWLMSRENMDNSLQCFLKLITYQIEELNALKEVKKEKPTDDVSKPMAEAMKTYFEMLQNIKTALLSIIQHRSLDYGISSRSTLFGPTPNNKPLDNVEGEEQQELPPSVRLLRDQ